MEISPELLAIISALLGVIGKSIFDTVRTRNRVQIIRATSDANEQESYFNVILALTKVLGDLNSGLSRLVTSDERLHRDNELIIQALDQLTQIVTILNKRLDIDVEKKANAINDKEKSN